jgi:archaemetzincin
MLKKVIYLQKIGDVDNIVLKKLKKNLKWVFKDIIDSVKISPETIPLMDSEYDHSRRQYNASLTLRRLLKHSGKSKYFRTLGIIDKDLFSRLLNFVFGIAIIPKKHFLESPGASLIQITRLKEKFYNRAENIAQFELRVLKEAVHELGHTFGLEHCNNRCVMQFSNSLAEADEKPAKFCTSCSKKLKDIIENLA